MASKTATTVPEAFRARFEWVKVEAPRPWDPEPGDELLGWYGGRTLRNGRFGQYEEVLIHVPRRGMLTASGTELTRLLDASQIVRGHPICVRFMGLVQGAHHIYKRWELEIAAGQDKIDPDEMPSFS